MNGGVARPIAGIVLYGWVNGTLAAGVGRLDQRLGLSATVVAVHLAAFAVGLTVAGLRPPHRHHGRWAPAVFVFALLPFLAAPHPLVSVTAAVVLGAAGSASLAEAQRAITEDRERDTTRTLLMANVGAGATAALAAWLVGALPSSMVPATVVPALVLAAVATLPASGSRTRDPAPTPAISAQWRPNRTENLGLVLIGLVVAVELSLANQLVGFLRDTGTSVGAAERGPALLFAGLTVGRLLGAFLDSRHGVRVLAVALGLTAAALLPVWLLSHATARLTAVAVAGVGIGPLYPLAVAHALESTRSTADLSSRSTAAIGAALFVAPIVVGGAIDVFTPRIGFGALLLLCLAAAVTLVRRQQLIGPTAQ